MGLSFRVNVRNKMCALLIPIFIERFLSLPLHLDFDLKEVMYVTYHVYTKKL